MKHHCTPKTRSVWHSLWVTIVCQKVGTNTHFQASRASQAMGFLLLIRVHSQWLQCLKGYRL